MKSIYLYLLCFLSVSVMQAQRLYSNIENYTKVTTLKYQKCETDSLPFDRSGFQVTWDFMELNCNGDIIDLQVQRPDSLIRAEFPMANLQEKNSDGSSKAFRKGGGRTFFLGYIDPSNGVKIEYLESLLSSRRPMSYGDKVSKDYVSSYTAEEDVKLNSKGSIKMEADGIGTLLLPNQIAEKVLRLKFKQNQEIPIEKYDTIHKTGMTIYEWFDDYQKSPLLKVTELRANEDSKIEILYLIEEKEEWRMTR